MSDTYCSKCKKFYRDTVKHLCSDCGDKKCTWTSDGKGQWDTGYKNELGFQAGGPANYGWTYCPYCGKKIEIKKGE